MNSIICSGLGTWENFGGIQNGEKVSGRKRHVTWKNFRIRSDFGIEEDKENEREREKGETDRKTDRHRNKD